VIIAENDWQDGRPQVDVCIRKRNSGFSLFPREWI